MATYRLEYSNSSEKLKHRIKKAVRSEASEIHCYNFPFDFDFRGLMGKVSAEGFSHQIQIFWFGRADEVLKVLVVGWDKVIIRINRPNVDLENSVNCENFVFEIHNKSDLYEWIVYIHRILSAKKSWNLYFDFLPESGRPGDAIGASEVSFFLEEIAQKHPSIQLARFPGSQIWDSRIPQDAELEASNDICLFDNTRSEKKHLSIIIPTYNCKYFLANVVRHLIDQTTDKELYEVIIVDDGGSDQSFEYLELVNDLSRVHLKYIYWPRIEVRERGQGLFRAGLCRNLGVRESGGEHIVFLDSDIIVGSNFVETIIKGLQDADVLQFPRYHIHSRLSDQTVRYSEVIDELTFIEEKNYWGPFFESKDWHKIASYWKYTCTYALAMRRSDFLLTGRFCHFYVSYGFEDTELGYRLAKMGKRFRLLSEKTFHLTANSLSEYQFSKSARFKLLSRTAKLFFLNTLDLDVYREFRIFLSNEVLDSSAFKKRLRFFR